MTAHDPSRSKFVWTVKARNRLRSVGGRRGLLYLAVVVCLGIAVPAHAQIYSWRDANGNLVLSNRRPGQPGLLKSYTVPKAETVRATRFAAAERGRVYDDLISEHSRLNGVRADLVRAVMQVESAFNPYARSPKGALGLMQLMPATIRQYRVSNPFSPSENVRAGVAYLRDLLDRYQHNEELALAAYNAGPGAVDKHGQSVPPYKETRNYVAQINQMAARPIEKRANAIYKVTDTIDGRAVPRYTDKKPTTGGYEVASR
jgi:soluble lytic murein transglycosylase-like protein